VTRAEWKESLDIALATISSQKLRSFLTMLGVVIGVASVISVAAIIDGLNGHVARKVQELGTSTFFLTRFKAFTLPPFPEEIRLRKKLTSEDAAAIREHCPTVRKVSPILTRGYGFGGDNEIRFQSSLVSNPILRGGEPELTQVLPVYVVHSGRFLTEEENLHAAPVCILGNAIADSLFGPVDPVGKEVRINGLPFQVIGVFEPHQGLFGGPGVDQFVIVPFRTFVKMYPEIEELIIGASATDPQQLGRAEEEVIEVLRHRRHVPANKPNDFEVISADFLTDLWQKLTSALVLLTLIIASIGLAVGGIGVMNIMLVSVTERTAEIGVRKAVGARRVDIRSQFLLEAVALTGSGGVVGILIGITLSLGVAALFPNLPARISIFWTLAGFVISLAVGLFFGIYPAVKAANLDPVACLRHE
jgi:putative ABC transport system permease protein